MPTRADVEAATPTCPKCMRPEPGRTYAVRRTLRWRQAAKAWYCRVHGRVLSGTICGAGWAR